MTTLTKKMAEDLTDFLLEMDLRVRYLHSEVDTLERVAILRDLRLGVFDVLVGINLLREGLDLPEVSLVGILDADKEGYLRSGTSLIQTIGRAARNVEGKVIMYADVVTESMARAIGETRRRRERQVAYNLEHGIEPRVDAQGNSRHSQHDRRDPRRTPRSSSARSCRATSRCKMARESGTQDARIRRQPRVRKGGGAARRADRTAQADRRQRVAAVPGQGAENLRARIKGVSRKLLEQLAQSMGKREFSDAFRTFVNKNITSVEQIEVLLILLANPQRTWSVGEISAIMRSSPNSIASRSNAMKPPNGERERGNGFQYAASGRSHEMVELLQEEYGARRFKRDRTGFFQTGSPPSFAQAFRLREESVNILAHPCICCARSPRSSARRCSCAVTGGIGCRSCFGVPSVSWDSS